MPSFQKGHAERVPAIKKLRVHLDTLAVERDGLLDLAHGEMTIGIVEKRFDFCGLVTHVGLGSCVKTHVELRLFTTTLKPRFEDFELLAENQGVLKALFQSGGVLALAQFLGIHENQNRTDV